MKALTNIEKGLRETIESMVGVVELIQQELKEQAEGRKAEAGTPEEDYKFIKVTERGLLRIEQRERKRTIGAVCNHFKCIQHNMKEGLNTQFQHAAPILEIIDILMIQIIAEIEEAGNNMGKNEPK